MCFERAASVGGEFRLAEDGVVWASCRLTSSAPLTTFSEIRGRPVPRAFEIARLLFSREIENLVGYIARRVSQAVAARTEQAVR